MDAPGATTVKRERDAVLTSRAGGFEPSSRLRDGNDRRAAAAGATSSLSRAGFGGA